MGFKKKNIAGEEVRRSLSLLSPPLHSHLPFRIQGAGEVPLIVDGASVGKEQQNWMPCVKWGSLRLTVVESTKEVCSVPSQMIFGSLWLGSYNVWDNLLPLLLLLPLNYFLCSRTDSALWHLVWVCACMWEHSSTQTCCIWCEMADDVDGLCPNSNNIKKAMAEIHFHTFSLAQDLNASCSGYKRILKSQRDAFIKISAQQKCSSYIFCSSWNYH